MLLFLITLQKEGEEEEEKKKIEEDFGTLRKGKRGVCGCI